MGKIGAGRLVAALKPNKSGTTFRDLTNAKTAKRLMEEGVSTVRLHYLLHGVEPEIQKFSEITKSDLNELHIVSSSKDVSVEDAGAQLGPLSRQLVGTEV